MFQQRKRFATLRSPFEMAKLEVGVAKGVASRSHWMQSFLFVFLASHPEMMAKNM